MPLNVRIDINGEDIHRLKIVNLGANNDGTYHYEAATYHVGTLPNLGATEVVFGPDNVAYFDHNRGDGAMECLRQALNALAEQEART